MRSFGRIAFFLLLAVSASHAAVASSFDCSRAHSSREKLVCTNPALSDLDSDLAADYQQTAKQIDSSGQAQLRRSEINWLNYIDLVCPSAGQKIIYGSSNTQEICLEQKYKQRTKYLEDSVRNSGSITIYQISDISASKSTDPNDETGSDPGFFVSTAIFWQINNPKSSSERLWNGENIQTISHSGCGASVYADDDNSESIGLFSSNIISTNLSSGTYCHGASHGFGSTESKTWILNPELRALTSNDIFGPQSNDWKTKFKSLFLSNLSASGWAGPSNQPSIKDHLAEYATGPDAWFFTHDGIQISFSSYQGGCYACNPEPVIITWSQLKPLIVHADLFPSNIREQ